MNIAVKKLKCLAPLLMLAVTHAFAQESVAADAHGYSTPSFENKEYPRGWSIDVGANYTWSSFTTPPTYTGNTGGIQAKATYEEPSHIFSQFRALYNLGHLGSQQNSCKEYQWRGEVVGGYCFSIASDWTVTPYGGIGVDLLTDDHSAYASVSSIQLSYETFYGIIGLNSRYTQNRWSFATQIECLPVLRQALSIKDVAGASWGLKRRVGLSVELPIGYNAKEDIWIEVSPFYRWMPVGVSDTLALPQRDLRQAGAVISVRFFL